tara:strand:+ start:84 stop:617 length:534 start_codon:yes stop_codon:yes gene_type:complete
MGGKGSGGNGRLPDEKRNEVFKNLKAGMGVNQTAVTCGVAHSTVARIREERADDLPNWKRQTAARMMQTASRLVEKVSDAVENGDGNIQQKTISLGILLDKAGQLRGESQSIGTIEHRHTIELPRLDGWISTQNAPKVAEVVEIGGKVSKGTGFENLNPPVSDAPSDEAQAHRGGGV